MNAYDLYEAIGSAEEQYLLHSERRVSKAGRRMTRLCLVLGILLMALLTAAAASPSVRRWLFGIERLYAVRMGEPVSAEAVPFAQNGLLALRPRAELREDPPQRLESYQIPMYLAEHWRPGNPVSEDMEEPDLFRKISTIRQSKGLEIRLVFEEPDSRSRLGNPIRLCFRQYAAALLEQEDPLLLLELPPDNAHSIRELTVSGFGVCAVLIPGWEIGMQEKDPQYWYLWSDGSYLYAAGMNREPEPELLEQIITSLGSVKSLRPYRKSDRIPLSPLTRNLMPAWVPEGYVLREDEEFSDFASGTVRFFWYGPAKSGNRRGSFRLTLCTDPEAPTDEQLFWAAEALPEYRDYTRTECTVRGRPAVLYESKLAVELIWQEADGVTVELHSEYAGHLSTEELLRIAASLEDAPIPVKQEETP